MSVLIGVESDFCSCLIRCAHKIDPAIMDILLGIEDRGPPKDVTLIVISFSNRAELFLIQYRCQLSAKGGAYLPLCTCFL